MILGNIKTNNTNNTLITTNTNHTLLPTSLPPRTSNCVHAIDYDDVPLAPCGQPSGIHTPCLPGWIPVCCQHALANNDQNSPSINSLTIESNVILNTPLENKPENNIVSDNNKNKQRKKDHNNFKYEIKGKNSFKNE